MVQLHGEPCHRAGLLRREAPGFVAVSLLRPTQPRWAVLAVPEPVLMIPFLARCTVHAESVRSLMTERRGLLLGGYRLVRVQNLLDPISAFSVCGVGVRLVGQFDGCCNPLADGFAVDLKGQCRGHDDLQTVLSHPGGVGRQDRG